MSRAIDRVVHAPAFVALSRYLGLLVPLAAMLLLFREVYLTTDLLATRALLIAVADAAVLLLPYWVLPRRWQPWCLVVVWLTALYLFANVVYLRHFGDLIPFSSWRLTRNMGTLTLASVASLVRWSDLAWAFLALAATADVVAQGGFREKSRASREAENRREGHSEIFEHSEKHRRGCSLAMRIGGILATLVLFGMAQYHLTNLMRDQWRHTMQERSRSSLLYMRYREYTFPITEMRNNGLPVMFVKSLYREFTLSGRHRELTDEEQREVSGYSAAQADDFARRIVPSAEYKALRSNSSKNLLFIIVESLNANVVGRVVGGDTITPTLNRLFTSPGVISSRQVHSMVDAGGSSDAALSYVTGLVPLHGEAVVMSYPDLAWKGTLPRMAHQCAATAEVIFESAEVWNQDRTSVAWGFDKLWSSDNHPFDSSLAADAQVFELTEQLMDSLPQPWLIKASTLSMHMPFYSYDRPDMPGMDANKNLSYNERRYLRATRYFDTQLGRLLEWMQARGLMDSTVVVIASDHNVGLAEDDFLRGAVEKRGDLVMLILGSGMERRIGEMSQMDVFPTVLDVMGWGDNTSWRGLGRSQIVPLPADEPKLEERERKAARVSELIIRSTR